MTYLAIMGSTPFNFIHSCVTLYGKKRFIEKYYTNFTGLIKKNVDAIKSPDVKLILASAGRSLDFELSNFVSVNCQRTSIIRDHEVKSKKWY